MSLKKNIKESVKDLLPPVITKIYKNKISRYGFKGNFSTWEEALKYSDGYDSEKILSKVKSSLVKVKNGEALYERDSVLFDKIEYSWPVLTALLWIASQNNNRLNLIDFGGSLGSSYFQNIKFLKHLSELRWNIIEQKNFVDCGRENFENKHIKFYYDIDTCVKEQKPDAILFSGVIQYIEEPYTLLKKIINYGFKYIMFDRTLFLNRGNDIITIQKIEPEIFDASYPCWFLNFDNFLSFFKDKYNLIADFEGFEKTYSKSIIFKGCIFQKKEV